MKQNEINFNLNNPEIRVKIIRIEKAFIMIQRIDEGPNKGYQKRFKRGIEQEAFKRFFEQVSPLIFELE